MLCSSKLNTDSFMRKIYYDILININCERKGNFKLKHVDKDIPLEVSTGNKVVFVCLFVCLFGRYLMRELI